MSNPFHSFHVQSGGVKLKKLANHYRNVSQNKNHKFQPLMLQEHKDLVVPMDLLHVPSSCSSPPFFHPSYQQYPPPHTEEDYYVYPEHPTTTQSHASPSLEIIKINLTPSYQPYTPYPVIDDTPFEEMFQNISTTPKHTKKSAKPRVKKLTKTLSKKSPKKSARKQTQKKRKSNAPSK